MQQHVNQRTGSAEKHHSPVRWPLVLLLLYICLPIAQSFPHYNQTLEEFNSTTDSGQDLIELIQQYTTVRPNFTQFTGVVHPVELTDQQWKSLISKGPLITRVAFDVGPKFSPTYAFVTYRSYSNYITELEEKCRQIEDENIADKRVDNLENGYFRWEEYQFSKALIKTLFPETKQGDQTRVRGSTRVINRIRLGKEIESHCQLIEQKDDWSTKTDERTSFEDHLIDNFSPKSNEEWPPSDGKTALRRIFQPRYFGEQAEAIIADIEDDNEYMDPRHFGNLTFSRKKRALRPMTLRQMKDEARIRLRKSRTKRHF